MLTKPPCKTSVKTSKCHGRSMGENGTRKIGSAVAANPADGTAESSAKSLIESMRWESFAIRIGTRGQSSRFPRKKTDGWFLHAITGETWLLKLKFRVARNTFKKDQLLAAFNLKTLNEMHDLPVYGNEPRVKCRNVRGPWQEIEFRLHDWQETDSPAFWKFLQQAVAGFHKMTHQVASNPDDYLPWKKLGRQWHFSRKGFPPRKTIAWPVELLEELCDMLHDVAGDGQFLWNNQLLVHYLVPAQREPWATIVTKQPDALQLSLNGPEGTATLGRIANLARNRSIEPGRGQLQVVKFRFRQPADLRVGDFEVFLGEHLAGVREGIAKAQV